MTRNPRRTLTLLATLALATGCSAPHESAQSRTDTNAPLRSLNSDTPALITFVNRSAESLHIYWIDFGGSRKLYQTLAAGTSYTQQTFLTHPWLVMDARGRTWNVYMPEALPRTVYLQAPGNAAVIAQ
jgi:hypothetical protein